MNLTIIIPVYNTQVHILKRCINSILSLKNIKYEIILINDGSTEENSKKYKRMLNNIKGKNIKYICKKNGGVSSARNIGLEKASGEYIMFVDSDDIIFSDQILQEHFQQKADIVLYNKIVIKHNKQIVIKEINRNVGEITAVYAVEQFVKNNKFHTPCAKLIKNSFLKKWNINFDTKIIHGEDAIFNLDMLSHDPKIYYTDKNIYGYYYDYTTAYNRWKNYPEIMFENLNYLHNRKRNAIHHFNLPNCRELEISLCNDYIDSLFRVSMNFCKKNNQNEKILKIVANNINNFSIENYHLNYNKKIKYTLIKKQKWAIINLLSKLRLFYLKFIKN